MSGRWVPPRKGSFRIQASPGACSCVQTAATALGMAPRCTGMCSACMTIRPSASNRAVEASRRSLMLAEWAERTSTTPISSQAARSAPSITCSSIASRLTRDITTASPSAVADQPGGTTSVDPGSSNTAGPSTSAVPGPSTAASSTSSPKRAEREPRRSASPAVAGSSSEPGRATATRTVTSSSRASGSR